RVVNMDVIKINDELCLHLSDIGMNAQIVKHYQENNWRGKLGYIRGALKMLFNNRQMQLVITTDKKEIVRVAYMVVLANATKYGTNAVINPNGNIFDGKFEIIIMRRLSPIEIGKMFFGGVGFNTDKIETLVAEKVDITSKKSVYFQVDGEYFAKKHTITAAIQKGALSILLPMENS